MVGRRGFTLLEMLLALSLGGLVVLVAHRLFAGVTDGTRRLQEARVTLDRAANARRWLIETLGSLDIRVDGTGRFYGRPNEVEFEYWSLSERGRVRWNRVTLAAMGGRFLARMSGGGKVVLADSVGRVDFDYLLDPTMHASWVREWMSQTSAPLAVRVRVTRRKAIDTLLFLVGSRG